jgi:hypothetical protein
MEEQPPRLLARWGQPPEQELSLQVLPSPRLLWLGAALERRWRNLDGLWSLQRSGWQDGGAIVMPMGNGREKATQWKMVMVAAQLQWAMATAVQWTALYLDKLLSPSKFIDRLNIIPWRHDTHDKVWDTTTITSLRKVEVEEELEEKVEV